MGVVAALAHAGADLSACNNDGSSSFLMASAGHVTCLALLIRLSGKEACPRVGTVTLLERVQRVILRLRNVWKAQRLDD